MYVIFDIDGTIANIEHRRHFVASKPKNWPAFARAMKDDTPHDDIIYLMQILYDAGATILLASGRGVEDAVTTVDWLTQQGIVCVPLDRFEAPHCRVGYAELYMRAEKDYRSDVIVKSEILDEIIEDMGGEEPFMVFDDRDGVVKMWRSRGLRCLQVAPGDF